MRENVCCVCAFWPAGSDFERERVSRGMKRVHYLGYYPLAGVGGGVENSTNFLTLHNGEQRAGSAEFWCVLTVSTVCRGVAFGVVWGRGWCCFTKGGGEGGSLSRKHTYRARRAGWEGRTNTCSYLAKTTTTTTTTSAVFRRWMLKIV